jgi:GTPase
VMMMTDVGPARARGDVAVSEADLEAIALLPRETPSLLVINKVDLLSAKVRLLPMIEAYLQAHPFREVIPTSLLRPGGTTRVLDAIVQLLPEGPPAYDADTLTDRPVSFFIREYVREQVLASTRGEIPHSVAVSIDAIDEGERALVVRATLHVDKEGQRRILIGKGGAQIKQIGIGARRRIEELVGRKVYLELFVRVTPAWKETSRQLAELGYEPGDKRARRAGGRLEQPARRRR